MTIETKNAIQTVVNYFLLGEEVSRDDVNNAIYFLAYQDQHAFAELGREVLRAMIKVDVARLHTRRATLVANLPTQGPLQ